MAKFTVVGCVFQDATQISQAFTVSCSAPDGFPGIPDELWAFICDNLGEALKYHLRTFDYNTMAYNGGHTEIILGPILQDRLKGLYDE